MRRAPRCLLPFMASVPLLQGFGGVPPGREGFAIDLTLPILISVVGVSLAAMSLWRTIRRDRQGDDAHLDQRLRHLEEHRIRVEEFMILRGSVPDRLATLERQVAVMNEVMGLLKTQLPKILNDTAKGRR